MQILSKLSENKHEVTDVVYLVALQGLNFIAPILVLPYLMVVLGAEKFGYILRLQCANILTWRWISVFICRLPNA